MTFKKKKTSSKPKSSKPTTAQIAQYLVAKNGKTKYLKIAAMKKAPPEVKELVKKLVKLLGSDILFVNLYDAEFRDKYNIQDFVKGTIQVSLENLNKPEEDEEEMYEEEVDEDDQEESEEEDDSDF